MKIFIRLLVICIFYNARELSAAGRLESFSIGDFNGFYSARGEAMGQTGRAKSDSITAIFNNPAALDVERSEFFFSPEENSQYERTQHNGPEKNIHETFFRYADIQNFSVAAGIGWLNLGIASGRTSDMNYQYSERDYRGDTVNEFKTTGGLNSSIAAARMKIKGVSLGASYHNLTGEKVVTRGRYYADEPNERYAFNGSRFIMGLLWKIGNDFTLGFTYGPSFDLTGERIVYEEKTNLKIPEELSAGFSLKVPIETDTVVNFEIIHVPWRNVYPDLINTTSFRAGAEHTLFEKYFFRYGIFYTPSYANYYPSPYFTRAENSVFGFTTGGGAALGRVTLDFAAVFAQRSDQNIPVLFQTPYDPKYPRGNLDVSDLYNTKFKFSLGLRL